MHYLCVCLQICCMVILRKYLLEGESGLMPENGYQYDVLYIGAGHGAFDGAAPLAAKGYKVGVIEVDKIGGTCPNRGCNAKITLDAPVELLRFQERMQKVVSGDLTFNWTENVKHEHEVIDGLPDFISGLLTDSGVDIINGHGKLVDAHTVDVDGTEKTADKIVVATGQRPHRLDIPGTELANDSTDFMALTELPQNITIIGSGYISMEFATIANAAGSDVTVLMHKDKALRSFNQSYVEHVIEDLQKRGVKFVKNANVTEFAKNGPQYTVSYGAGQTLETDWILDASGRIPNVEELGLEKVGVKYNEHGIEVNDHLQTSVDNIYASGDVVDKKQPKLTPTAIYETTYLMKLFSKETNDPLVYPAIPSVVFTSPRIAQVGVIPDAVADDNSYSVQENDLLAGWYRLVTNESYAKNTIVYDAKHKIVGASEVSERADNAVNSILPAIEFGWGEEEISRLVYLFPSLESDTKDLL